jgi:hypothetical protein
VTYLEQRTELEDFVKNWRGSTGEVAQTVVVPRQVFLTMLLRCKLWEALQKDLDTLEERSL